MGTTGLIFGAIALGWLAYLIPWFVTSKRDAEPVDDVVPLDRLSTSMTIIRRGTDPLTDEPDPDLELTTPFTRSAAMREIRRANRLAVTRRRRLMVSLVLITVVLAIVPLMTTRLPWWSFLVTLAMTVVSQGICRYSVVTLRRTLDERVRLVTAGWENETMCLDLPIEVRSSDELSIELSAPVAMAGSLWDPIPVTTPTYVSKPLVPRTVRTIDLSAPEPVPARTPVTAEGLGEVADEDERYADFRRPVGE
ncbi:MAG TPA: hypothetical protein VLR88_00230 [Propionibacteriaceae bacterium]|nr:hypothetical protein [Propionibacteriaceae bacterium]